MVDDETPNSFRLAPGHVALAAVVVWIATLLLGGPILAASADRPGNPLSWARSVHLAANVVTLTVVRTTWAQPTVAWAVAVTLVAQTALFAFAAAAALRLANSRPSGTTWAIIVLFPAAAWLALAGTGMHPLDAASALAGSGLLSQAASPDVGDFWLKLVPIAIAGGLAPFALARFVAGPDAGPQLRLVLAATATLFAVALAVAWPLGQPALAADVLAGGLTDLPADLPAAGRFATTFLVLLAGLRPTTLLVLALGTVALLRGRPDRPAGVAIAWLFAFVLLFAVTFVVLIALIPQRPADAVALLAAGAVSNHALTAVPPDATGPDAWVQATAMVLGRLLSIAALWWAVTRPRATVAAAG